MSASQSPRGSAPKAFLQALPETRLFENHAEVLSVWAKEGVRNKVILHFDSHHDMLSMKGKKDFEPLREMVSSGDFAGVDRAGNDIFPGSLYNYTDFLVAAFHLGIAREIWWVVPRDEPMDDEFLAAMKKFLSEMQFGILDKGEISRFHIDGEHIKGSISGIPLTVSGVDALPFFDNPVLLDIDCDYFVGDPSWGLGGDFRSSGMQEPLAGFLSAVRKKRIPVDLATVVYSVEGNYLPIHFKYLGRLLRDWLVTPGAAEVALASPSWKEFWEGERAFLSGDWTRAASIFEGTSRLAGEIADFSSLYLVFVAMIRGDAGRALSVMETLVARAPEYSLGYLGMADYYARTDETATALDLYERVGQYPLVGTYLRLSRLGHYYFNRGDPAKALDYYSQLLGLYPHRHVVRSYLGDAHFSLGDQQAAYRLYREVWLSGEQTLQRINPNYLPNFIASSLVVGDRESAQKALAVLLAIDPSNSRIDDLRSRFDSPARGDGEMPGR